MGFGKNFTPPKKQKNILSKAMERRNKQVFNIQYLNLFFLVNMMNIYLTTYNLFEVSLQATLLEAVYYILGPTHIFMVQLLWQLYFLTYPCAYDTFIHNTGIHMTKEFNTVYTHTHTCSHLHAVTHFPSHYYTNIISSAHNFSHIHKFPCNIPEED